MRKLIVFFVACITISCTKKVEQSSSIQEEESKIDTQAYLAERKLLFDSIYAEECKRLGWHSEKRSEIAWIYALEQIGLPLTEEEIAYWDSLNEASGEGVFIRGSERNLDTIINHMRYWFTTAE